MAGLPIPKKKAPEAEKEPVYAHQHFPKMLFNRIKGQPVDKTVNSEAELKQLLKAGWSETPADFPAPDDEVSADDQISQLLDDVETLKAENEKLKKASKDK